MAGDVRRAAAITDGMRGMLMTSLGSGYRLLFLTAAAFAFGSAAATWILIRASDTGPAL